MSRGFLSRIVNRELFKALSDATDLTAVVGDRIHRGNRLPGGVRLPACLFYMEASSYDTRMDNVPAEHITSGSYRFVVEVHDQGESDSRIAPAAEGQFARLAGTQIYTDDGYQLTFTAMGEIPFTNDWDGETPYQRLGTTYQIYVTKG